MTGRLPGPALYGCRGPFQVLAPIADGRGATVDVTPPEHCTSYLTSLKASALQASVNSAVVSLPSVSVSNFWVSGVAAIAVRYPWPSVASTEPSLLASTVSHVVLHAASSAALAGIASADRTTTTAGNRAFIATLLTIRRTIQGTLNLSGGSAGLRTAGQMGADPLSRLVVRIQNATNCRTSPGSGVSSCRALAQQSRSVRMVPSRSGSFES